MTTPAVIPINRVIHESENYGFLREEGMKYIESLSSNLWTDYNIHDPGITILEAICYAITDLGYRTSLPMQDLLAKEGMDYSEPIPPLFTARNILTNNPLTITDYRKMLVDIEGVKNAWLEIADCQEADFYANCNESRLEYFALDYKIDYSKQEIRDALIQALNVFKEDPNNLNKEKFKFQFTTKADIAGTNVSYLFEIPLPGWLEILNNINSYIDFINLDSIISIDIRNSRFNNDTNIWAGSIHVRFTVDGRPDYITFEDVVISNVQQLDVRTALEFFLEEISPENPIFLYQQTIKYQLAQGIEHTVRLRGLWEVLLQYDVDDRFGDLNSTQMNYRMVIDEGGEPKEVNLEIVGPSWEPMYKDLKTYEPFILSSGITGYTLVNNFADSRNNIFTTDIVITYTYDGNPQTITFENLIFKGISNQVELEKDLINILIFFKGRLMKLYDITRTAECKLHEHRNLCEDFKTISSICVNDIGVCADIELENSASLIKVQAEILFQIQQYISPPIQFYTLKEMVDKGIPTEDIFNGPKLDHGFIFDEEIEKSSLDKIRFVYASDIINIIQDIPGVISVKNLLLTKYDKSGNPILPSEPWCLRIDPLHKAELSLNKSKILFFKDSLPYILSSDKYHKMLDEVNKLRIIHERHKLINTELDFQIPEGTPLALDDYSPLRYSLPQTYGVGVNGLPGSVEESRKAKAKQLSAFLAHFDQLLANYLSQLTNLGKVFSADRQVAENLKRTYYNNFLQEDETQVDYLNATTLEDVGSTIGARSLQRLTESHDDYLDRRNRFLDHLLGRFAEDFTEYALMVFSTEDDDTQQELIYDKASFLEDYPTISFERGKAFNYKHGYAYSEVKEVPLWNTDNVVGLKKRMSKLLGMSQVLRQDFHCLTIRDEFEVVKTGTQFTFQLKWGTQITHTSPKMFATYEEALYAREEAILYATSEDNYIDGTNFYQIKSSASNEDAPDIFLESETFSPAADALKAREDFYHRMSNDFAQAPLYAFHIEKNGADYMLKMLLRNVEVFVNPDVFTTEEEALEAKQKTMELILDEKNYKIVPVGSKFVLHIGVLDLEDATNDVIYCEGTKQYDSEELAELGVEKTVRTFKSSCFDCQYFDVLLDVTGGAFEFFLKKGTQTIVKGIAPFSNKDKMLQAKEKAMEASFNLDNYDFLPSNVDDTPPFIFQIGRVKRDDATGNVLSIDVIAKSEAEYLTLAEAKDAATALQRKINADPHCQIEGMHLIEHLLLRPKNEFKDDFFEVCLDKTCTMCGQEDPYSFRASVVFPYWTRKFNTGDPKLKKRYYVDRMLRQEAPAHVHLKICWIDNFQMRVLDLHYRRWLEENAKQCPDADVLTGRLNALLDILGKLRNRYPEGFLHDCEDSEEENTILLNKTFLGSYNSPDE